MLDLLLQYTLQHRFASLYAKHREHRVCMRCKVGNSADVMVQSSTISMMPRKSQGEHSWLEEMQYDLIWFLSTSSQEMA